MDAKLDFNNSSTGKGCDVSLTYYAWLKVKDSVLGGMSIEDLKIKNSGEEVVSEVNFREFLLRIVSISHDIGLMSDEEEGVLNDIVDYLSVPIDGVSEPIPSTENNTRDLVDSID